MSINSRLRNIQRSLKGREVALFWKTSQAKGGYLEYCSLRTFWSQKHAVDRISEGYFEGHEVLFGDVRERLTSIQETAEQLITGYNWFAEKNGKDAIEMDSAPGSPRNVEQLLNAWVMISRRKVLSAQGKLFEARDEILHLLNSSRR